MLEKVDQQKGTDLRGKCKTRLPAFVSVAILEAVQRYYPVPAVRIFYFQDGGDVANPARLSPCILARKWLSVSRIGNNLLLEGIHADHFVIYEYP